MLKHAKLAALRSLLQQMEQEFGLRDLNSLQKDVYYAACLLADTDPTIDGEALRSHPLLREIPRSTYFRVLKDLKESGYLRSIGGARSGLYQIAG